MKEIIKLTHGKIDDMPIEEVRRHVKKLESVIWQIVEHEKWVNNIEIEK